MGLKDLLDMSEVNAVRRAVPKYQIPTRLDEKTAKDVDDTKLDAAFKKAVWKRDKNLCRYCECKVLKSLELQANRGEVHHLAGRVDRAVRYDRRNGLLLCSRHHQAVTRNELHIIGTAKQVFRVGTKSYLNADKKLQFKPEAPTNGTTR